MESSANGSTLKRPGTTAEDVFDRLVQGILSGDLSQGTPLREAQLARAWGVSRTPMREAVRRASEAGLVTLRRNQAPLVRALTAEDVHGLYELRELLELHALKLAFKRIKVDRLVRLAGGAKPGASRQWHERCLSFDLALHDAWRTECGNTWLQADLERRYQFLRIVQNWIARDDEALDQAYHEHVAILDAIRSRDRAAAMQNLRRHIQNSAVVVARALRQLQAKEEV